ncbi:MAG: hypothetical protein GWM90_20950 [Gemmatimonadetes bacterium]|nr:hypothetical protein [Gemmatimonadota bacterium]NIQ56968.1 hypothetical protein [Gemmatimonadota bacterium]NIU77139.1 hypothetical protein [Gammaproteobacteria bacterium]NIX46460.1 hypothetical protein [Gemmatimonadota bacterium]NIY10775.1 hypothetical protein [Gemmatimonadota bacterium]
MGEKKSMLRRVVTWTILGVLAVLAIRIALKLLGVLVGVVGMAFGLAMFLLFTVAPVVILGWLAVKAWQAFSKKNDTA